jgi:hypothetical protein
MGAFGDDAFAEGDAIGADPVRPVDRMAAARGIGFGLVLGIGVWAVIGLAVLLLR